MILKFTGQNNDYGLIHGNIYDVMITSRGDNIVVCWCYKNTLTSCSYSSPQGLAADWQKM